MESIDSGVAADSGTAVARLARFYEHLTPDCLEQPEHYYAPDARFKDPFNEACGVAAIARIFAHMFATLDQPRFVVTQQCSQADQAFLCWEFHYRMRRWRAGVDQCIHGATWVRFDAQGLVVLHRDYWDAAQELYEKLPVLGRLMHWLRKTLAAE